MESKINEERIKKLPFIFRQRIENISKADPEILDLEILFCEQTVIIISYVEKKIKDESSLSSMTLDQYKKIFPLREEVIIWQFSCRPAEERKILTPKISEELHAVSLMMARLYFSNHSEKIYTLPAGICLF